MKFWLKLSLSNWATRLLYLCLATDVGLIFVHIVHWQTSLANSHLFSIEADRGYAEFFQYIKEYWIVLLLGLTALERRSILYLSWASLFVYLLLDDSLHIHERLGESISIKFAFSDLLGIRAIDLGELIVSGAFGLTFLIFIAVSYQFGDSKFRRTSKRLTFLMLILVLFGVVIDMIHGVLNFTKISSLIGLLEDGGEMLVMSTIVCFAFSLLGSSQAQSETATKLVENPNAFE
ncbi:hypothetical protein ACKFKF_00290 [Phormidesmis sp. 146-12]